MSSLYEITQNAAYLQMLLEEGDIDDQTYRDSVESLCAEDKVESICYVMKNLEHSAAAYKAEIDRMTARKRTLENGVERLKKSLVEYMQTVNTKKVDAGLFSISLRSSKSTNIIDEALIPSEYFIPQPEKLDKASIGKALKEGQEIPGAELVENPYVMIR